MECVKCGKEVQVVCLCGLCDECNGVDTEKRDKEFNEWLEKEKEKLKWQG